MSDVTPISTPQHSESAVQLQGTGLHDVIKCLWTHNPFYLISLALVLHSTRLWHHDSVDVFNPWPLISIIGGYLLLISVTGYLLIRFGRVWDDARSIFLVILLLFVELSLIFDSSLQRHFPEGVQLAVIGWVASIAISEVLLRGLKISLPLAYRGPYHLLLALMYLYPVFVASGNHPATTLWRIFWFSSCVGAALLTLLPAIHFGRKSLLNNGTPWPWPWYPWTLFGFLALCLSLRAWVLTLSFDPVLSQGFDEAMQLQGMFGCYFLIPIILAIGVLLFEAGVVERRQTLLLYGLGAPLLALACAYPYEGGSFPYLEFRREITNLWGSPTWLTLNAAWLFFAYALLRGATTSLIGLLVTASALMIFPRAWPTGIEPALPAELPLLISAFLVLLSGWRQGDSRIFVAGFSGLCIAGYDLMPEFMGVAIRAAIVWNLACLGVLLSGLMFRDSAARVCQILGSSLLAFNCAMAIMLAALVDLQLPLGAQLLYGVCVALTATGYFVLTRLRECWYSAMVCWALTAARFVLDFAEFLKRSFHWDGALYFVVGMLTFAIAVTISLVKSQRTLQESTLPIAMPPANLD